MRLRTSERVSIGSCSFYSIKGHSNIAAVSLMCYFHVDLVPALFLETGTSRGDTSLLKFFKCSIYVSTLRQV